MRLIVCLLVLASLSNVVPVHAQSMGSWCKEPRVGYDGRDLPIVCYDFSSFEYFEREPDERGHIWYGIEFTGWWSVDGARVHALMSEMEFQSYTTGTGLYVPNVDTFGYQSYIRNWPAETEPYDWYNGFRGLRLMKWADEEGQEFAWSDYYQDPIFGAFELGSCGSYTQLATCVISVPEPGTLILMLSGLASLGLAAGVGRHRKVRRV